MESDKSYSGRFVVRVPPFLHEKLVKAAEAEGISLNTLVQTCLAESATRLAAERRHKRLDRKQAERFVEAERT